MKNAASQFVIDYFMNSNEFDFKDFDLNEIIEEITPLFNSALNNYLYIKLNEKKSIGFLKSSLNTAFRSGGASSLPETPQAP